MNLTFIISCLALILGFIGSVLLAFSLSTYLKMIKTAVIAHEASIQTIASLLNPNASGDAVVFRGFQKHLDALNKTSNNKTKIGIILIALSFFIQLVSLLLQYYSC